MSNIDTGLHYPIELDRLPAGWSCGLVGEFCDVIQSGFACGQHSDDNIGVIHLRPMNVSRKGEVDLTVKKFVPITYDDRRLSAGNVLFNNTNSPELIGKTAYVTTEADGLAFSNHMTRIKFNSAVNAKYGAYQLHYLWMARYYMHKCVKHVNQASISSRDFSRSIPFVVPPTSEQHRIVAKIEELFSELDKGIESLKTAREQLKVYRQALLKHAFEGKLTEQWRKDNADKLETADQLLERIKQEREARYQQQLKAWKAAVKQWEAAGKKEKKPAKPNKPELIGDIVQEEYLLLFDLSEMHSWQRFGNIYYESVLGKMLDKKKNKGTPKPYLRNVNVRWGCFDLSDILEMRFEDSELPRYTVSKGDLVICEGGEPGRCAVWKNEGEFLIQKALHRIRLIGSLMSPEYIQYFIKFSAKQGVLSNYFTGTTIKHLTGASLAKLPLPLMAIDEQLLIVEYLDGQFAYCDQLDADLEINIAKSEALRQSILKKAFSGQLVPQDPNDEPASVLLERIAKEKEAAGVKVKKTKAAKKKTKTTQSRTRETR